MRATLTETRPGWKNEAKHAKKVAAGTTVTITGLDRHSGRIKAKTADGYHMSLTQDQATTE